MTTVGKPSILRAEADQTVAASSSSSSGETGGGQESPRSLGQGARYRLAGKPPTSATESKPPMARASGIR